MSGVEVRSPQVGRALQVFESGGERSRSWVMAKGGVSDHPHTPACGHTPAIQGLEVDPWVPPLLCVSAHFTVHTVLLPDEILLRLGVSCKT